MRFLHTSDWHLGRIFHGVHLTGDQAHILDGFVDLVGWSKPDAVLIAGDIYDRAVPPVEAVQLLDETITRILLDHRVPVIMIAGNHDSAERLGFGTRLLARQGLHLVVRPGQNLAPVVIHDEHGPVYFCPFPYAEPPLVQLTFEDPEIRDHNQALTRLAQHYSLQLPPGQRAVAVAHAFVAGGRESDSERPLSLGGTGWVDTCCFQPFNYTALGHLHQCQSFGETSICYAGSLMKYSFSEASHKKSVNLVEMDQTGKVALERISLTLQKDVRCIEGFLAELLKGPQPGENRNDYLMVTLKDSGAILDAIGKLREVYPNVLHIERPHLAVNGELRGPGGDHRRTGVMELFDSFFQQTVGEPLPEDLAGAFSETVEKLYLRDREVPA
ncbi:exonuclease SbcCD subunit D [Desulfotruncus alcoholivorax]|uniref:exonuclease SbcCD subunit D n=1 Tax=Desulfotruncus alcoholivorax TaxID=265477 RepID=UPI0004022915|nr:exonuclease SbcCD subunit D [Desulfotruncus alcoholivorax]